MGSCRCGEKLGFRRSGLCRDCHEELEKAEKALALVTRLNPEWEDDGYRYKFAAHTPDGELVQGQLESSGGHWNLVLHVNEVLLWSIPNSKARWIEDEKLSPYMQYIPAVQARRRRKEEAEEADELKRQRDNDLRRKFGA